LTDEESLTQTNKKFKFDSEMSLNAKNEQIFVPGTNILLKKKISDLETNDQEFVSSKKIVNNLLENIKLKKRTKSSKEGSFILNYRH
jgi:hypothetical protein